MHYSATMREVGEAVALALAETRRDMTLDELSGRLGVCRRTVERALARLEAKGRVRPGPARPARTWVAV